MSALSNAEKQARHRHYRRLAIEVYEKMTKIPIKDLIQDLKAWEEEHGEAYRS